MWLFNDKEFTQEMIPENAIGFIYQMSIPDQDGTETLLYIGKKNFFSDVKTKLNKKELPTDKRLKTYKRVRKFNYQNYFSSNEIIKQHKKNGGEVKREILTFAYSKQELTYLECKYQFLFGVLESDKYLNSNILGKFYKFKNS